MTLTTELAEGVNQLDSLLQLLSDLPEGSESSLQTQLNAFLEQMKRIESMTTEASSLHLPLDLIEHIDKSTSSQPIEEAILNDFSELDRLTTLLRTTKTHYQSLQ